MLVIIVRGEPSWIPKELNEAMATHKYKRNQIFTRFVILVFFSFITTFGCAMNLYQCWDAQLKQMVEAPTESLYTIDDVSLLLGVPPYKCERFESAHPIIGILLAQGKPQVTLVLPNSPASPY